MSRQEVESWIKQAKRELREDERYWEEFMQRQEDRKKEIWILVLYSIVVAVFCVFSVLVVFK